jgi:hypothetical protein
MPPRLLVLVQQAGQDPATVPITQPEEWDGQTCATCERRIENETIVYLIEGEVRCHVCVESRPQPRGCLWCGRMPARRQDTGHLMCQPCWTIYVAYVADEVEPADSPFRQLTADVWRIRQKERLKRGPDPPEGEDRPS